MSIINSYRLKFVPLPQLDQEQSYGQNQITTIDRNRTFCAGRGLWQLRYPLFPNALPCRTFEIERSFKPRDRSTDGYVTYIRQFLGETLRRVRYRWSVYPPWTWAQAYHGLLGRTNSS